MSHVQYRIGTVSFPEESCATWGTRSQQILRALSLWGSEGWRISRLNGAPRIALAARGFCLLLERDLEAAGRGARLGRILPRAPRKRKANLLSRAC